MKVIFEIIMVNIASNVYLECNMKVWVKATSVFLNLVFFLCLSIEHK